MSKTPQFLIDAVTAQQERKREELAALQETEKAALLAVQAAQAAYVAAQDRVNSVKDELEEIREYLLKEKLATLVSQQVADDHAPEPAETEPNEDDSTTIDGEGVSVSGRPLRKIVTAYALEVAGEKKFFTVDDLMLKLKEKKVTLNVENPRTRASQVLTLTKGFVYDEVQKAWTKSATEERRSAEAVN